MANPTGLSALAGRAVAEPIAIVISKVMAAQAAGKDIISLAAGLPDEKLLPTDKMGKLFDEACTKYPGLLNYTRPQGWPPANMAMEHMLTQMGVKCKAENILITSGGMEALSLAAQLTLNEGDTVLAESPAYPGAVSTFKLIGANVVHVPGDEGSMTPEALEAAIKEHKPKLVSLMPDYQNPSGAVMPLERRPKIAELLKKYDVYAVEDGAYAQLCFEGDLLPPLQSFAPEKVFYETSVSKIMAPAMRIGALVVPSDEFLQRAGGIKFTYNMQASAMNEALVERFISPDNTYLADNLKLLRETYKRRRDLMEGALKKHLPKNSGFAWNSPKGGMFLWLTGPKTVNFTTLLDKAIENGVAYVPGSMFYAEAQDHNSARLNFASMPEDRIEEAIRRLAKIL